MIRCLKWQYNKENIYINNARDLMMSGRVD